MTVSAVLMTAALALHLVSPHVDPRGPGTAKVVGTDGVTTVRIGHVTITVETTAVAAVQAGTARATRIE